MKIALLVLGLTVAAAYSSVVPINGEKKIADALYLKRQKQVLDLFVGIGHNEYFHNEYSDYDIAANIDQFHDSGFVKHFLEQYKQGFLPPNGVFSLSCPHTLNHTISLFDVFYFASDFDAFYKAASWAKKHIHPHQFAYAYTLALTHREDCYNFVLPPYYEIFPTYFVPQDTIQKAYSAKMYGLKEGMFPYNNTGYEYSYYDTIYGGQMGMGLFGSYGDYKVSYFSEDVGMNNYYYWWNLHYPFWMKPEKYRKSNWLKSGEGFYYTHQQLFARYSLERFANELPFVQPLYWEKPIHTGYNPRITHFNGQPFYARGDFVTPSHYNQYYLKKAQAYESRLYEAIDSGSFWDNKTYLQINNYDGVDLLGNAVYGAYFTPNKHYYGNYHYSAMQALAYIVNTATTGMYSYGGGVTGYYETALRDPAFYNYLYKLVNLFQWHKKYLYAYTHQDLTFPGVSVQDVEIDKFLTYFERYEYEITNALPVYNYNEYANLKYYTSQYRLNHKPYTYKITVNSNGAYEGMVRVFLGPKYDAHGHLLTLEQKRLLMVEIDRFPVTITNGNNVFERSSKESPIFSGDYQGFRQLYAKINKAIKNQEPYYFNEKVTCGVPERLQLPRGWKSGRDYTLSVVVSPYTRKYSGNTHHFKATCGSPQLFDYRPYGYPFDRPINTPAFHTPNIYFKDVPIYHRDEYEMKPLMDQYYGQ